MPNKLLPDDLLRLIAAKECPQECCAVPNDTVQNLAADLLDDRARIDKALEFAFRSGGVDGEHHKMWVIDQMVRALTDCPMVKRTATDCHGKPYEYETQGESEEYLQWVKKRKDGEDGPETYGWDEGIAP